MKRKSALAFDVTVELDGSEMQLVDVELSTTRQPQGTKTIKEHQKIQCLNEFTARVQARVTRDMALATLKKKVAIMEDQSMIALFTILEASLVSKKSL
jgi:glucose-6-phosphate dehydrogenase assembly protein OpcA